MATLPTIDPAQVLAAAYDATDDSLRTVDAGAAGPLVEHDRDPALIWLSVYDPVTRGLRVVSV